MADILFVSKALAPPWNDSGKNLVYDLARGLRRHRPTLMVASGASLELAGASLLPVYARAGGFAPALLDQTRVFGSLLRSRGHGLWHFFFAPNPRSCLAGRAATRLRRMRVVHTISSAPRDPRAIVPLLFAQQNVVLSAHTERRLLEAGLPAQRMTRIAPAITPLTPREGASGSELRRTFGLPEDAPLLLYPGDLEFGEGAGLTIGALRGLPREVHLVMACRTKTVGAREAERSLRARCAAEGLSARVHFVGETARIHDLLACADVVVLPSVDLYAKMDYPLVLLEAMSLLRPVVVARGSAAEELAQQGGALAVPARVDALVHELTRLLDDRAERRALGQRARAAVLASYTVERMAAAYERLYDQLL